MIDIASLISVCETAIRGGSKLVEQYRSKKLSAHERDLLLAAAESGEFRILEVDQHPGSWVRAGRKDFMSQDDPALAAMYLEAFRSLCERGFVVHEGGNLFMLTGSGFTTARQLSKPK